MISRRADDGPAPTTIAQERLWFVEQLAPGSSSYHIAEAFLLGAEVDAGALAWSLGELVRRQAALRTTFALVDGRPVQVVRAPESLQLEEQSLPSAGSPEEAAEVLREEACRPFDLDAGPLFRASLFRLGSGERVLALALHHLIADGVSLSVFQRELEELYAARVAKRAPVLPELPVQYTDFAAWQRERLGTARLKEKLSYWREQLAELPVLEFPSARARKSGLGQGAVERLTLPAALSQDVHALCRDAGVTPFLLTLAVFEVLLARYTGMRDIVVGTPVAGRDREEVEGLIGYFVNLLVLRTDLGGELTGRELLTRVRETVLAAFDHQEVPFGQLVDELAPERDTTRNPLFQVTFQYDAGGESASGPATASATGASPSLALQPLGVELGTTRFDLEARVYQDADGLIVTLTYNADLLDADLVRRMLDHYGALLGALVAEPERPVSELARGTEAERELLFRTWGAREALSPELAEATVHGLFRARAAAAPDAIALECGAERLTYRELEVRANQLAHELAQRGVGAETTVGLCLERGTDLIVAMLGVLGAGGTYVPLDPEFPTARLAMMVEDVKPLLLLVHGALRDRVPELRTEDGADAVIVLDDEAVRAQLAARPASALEREVAASQIAHVLFTSGSTGRPKGVPLPHRGIVRLTQEIHSFAFRATDVVTQISNAAFDAATYEIWSALLNGARLVVVPRDVSLSATQLGQELRDRGVTVVFLTTALLSQMVDADPDLFGGLRGLLFGGEAADASRLRALLANRARGRGPEHLINLYGPTENSTLSTWFEVEHVSEGASSVPIGSPISHSTVYLLDDELQPVPIGAPGELCVGGEGLARGYFGNPALTAERFVPDPFGGAGERMYRTGDLAYFRPDGEIQFLGRADHQVKVRGFRIELSEIEAVLAGLDGVRDAIVVAHADARGAKQLAAYAVASSETSGNALREALKERLPSYMVPASLVVLEALPLTPNGKVDRRALPAPEAGQAVARDHVAPRGELEQRVAAIWRDVLELEQVGVHDNFFDLGGHSLRLVQVHTRLTQELASELSITDLFQFVTVAAIAERLGGGAASDADAGAVSRRGRARGERRSARRARATLTGTDAPESAEDLSDDRIAVVAVAGRFPEAPDVERFWQNLCEGVESIRVSSDADLLAAGVTEGALGLDNLVRARPVLDGVELFDARYFGLTPREAELMDPQQRLFLECAVEALERAGCDPERFDGSIGVYAGSSENTYDALVRAHPDLAAGAGLQGAVGRGRDFLPTRVSYELDLRGPSLNVQTACSSSLVAVHQACRALAGGECDLALAGGVAISVPVIAGYFHQAGDIYSEDGHCRPFDAAANGTLRGDGLGLVVLKRLADAERDGDSVLAVILGSAVNNDGRAKIGFAAPSLDGQTEVVAMAQAAAGVEPESIGYVEAHGIASPLGDPIELTALTRAFAPDSIGSINSSGPSGPSGPADSSGPGADRAKTCALGSLKSNMGHLDAASGVAALIKTVLTLEHGRIPPTLHYETPNPELDLDAGPFFVNTELRDWSRADGAARRAGVSNFGIGGTNAHVVLEEAPERRASDSARGEQLLVLSARTPAALDKLAENLAAWLAAHPDANLADVAFTLQVGRRQLECRRTIRCREVDEAARALRGEHAELVASGRAANSGETAVFTAERGADDALPPGLAEAWLRGESVDWRALHAGTRRQLLVLPSYPFERQRYWAGDGLQLAPGSPVESAAGTTSTQAAGLSRHPRPDLETPYAEPTTEAERTLAGIWSVLFGFERVGVHDNWFELGGDSVLGIQVVARAREAGLVLNPASLFEHPTVAELAAVTGDGAAVPGSASSSAAAAAPADQGPLVGPVELTPIQHWFLGKQFEDAHHFNQSNFLTVEPRLARDAWRGLVARLFAHHDGLRFRYAKGAGGWTQRAEAPGGEPPLTWIELGSTPAAEASAAITAAATEAQSSLDLERGPLARVVVFDQGPDRPQRVFFVVHHLVVDVVSWPVLSGDLARLVEQLGRGEEPRLAPKTMSFGAWSSRLAEHARSQAVRSQLDTWTGLPWSGVRRLPVDHEGGANTAGSVRSVLRMLEEPDSQRLLGRVTRVEAQLPEALLAALAVAFTQWTKAPAFLVDVEGHGRESVFGPVDLTRTVGWFTAMYPVVLDGSELADTDRALWAVSAAKRALPDDGAGQGHGLGYGLLRFVSDDALVRERMERLPEAEVVLLYLGNQGVRAKVEEPRTGGDEAPLSLGTPQSPRARRTHLLEVQVSLTDRCLHTTWNYSENVHERATVEALADRFQAALGALADSSATPPVYAAPERAAAVAADETAAAPAGGFMGTLAGLAQRLFRGRRGSGAEGPEPSQAAAKPGAKPTAKTGAKFELAGLDDDELSQVAALLQQADEER